MTQTHTPRSGDFASNVQATPAITATGTNGANGIEASSDTGNGIVGSSTDGTGIYGQSGSGLAGHFVGNVQIDNHLNVSGNVGVGTATPRNPLGIRSSGADQELLSFEDPSGTTKWHINQDLAGNAGLNFAETNVADGRLFLQAGGNVGIGTTTPAAKLDVMGDIHVSGNAGHFVGNVTMDNNLTVTSALSTGTLSSGAGAFASSVSGTPAVKATGTNEANGVEASSDIGTGVFGKSSTGTGVFGKSISSMGVFGESSSERGIHGFSDSGTGVQGSSNSGTGIQGQSISGLAGLFDGNVQVNGSFKATGVKSFVQAHPTDPSREIVYVALEGGEAGTYVRGSGQLQSGKAVLALPEHFGLVTETSGLTVQLTPRGEWLQLYVAELDTAQLVVREAQGKSGLFDYFICGVRRGYEQHEVICTKR